MARGYLAGSGVGAERRDGARPHRSVQRHAGPRLARRTRRSASAVGGRARLGTKPAVVALAWVLSKPYVTAPIIGASKPHHLADAVAALELKLDAETSRSWRSPTGRRRWWGTSRLLLVQPLRRVVAGMAANRAAASTLGEDGCEEEGAWSDRPRRAMDSATTSRPRHLGLACPRGHSKANTGIPLETAIRQLLEEQPLLTDHRRGDAPQWIVSLRQAPDRRRHPLGSLRPLRPVLGGGQSLRPGTSRRATTRADRCCAGDAVAPCDCAGRTAPPVDDSRRGYAVEWVGVRGPGTHASPRPRPDHPGVVHRSLARARRTHDSPAWTMAGMPTARAPSAS